MAKKGAQTNDDLLAQLDDLALGEEEQQTKRIPKSSSTRAARGPAVQQQEEADLLAELDHLTQARPQSRPHTPRPPINTVSAAQTSPTKGGTATPTPTGSTRTSEERVTNSAQTRKSGESTRSFHQSLTPADSDAGVENEKAVQKEPEPAPAPSSGGGWWGGLIATASAAVKQAESLAKEIQKNEEAQRWAEQVKGNVGALRGLGGQLSSRALPTFTNILQTLAPPISSHERLQIHITHDFIGYPSLDPLIYQTFSRVMAQVEGGDLMVIQRGQESSHRRASEAGYTGSLGLSGWSDGPWWRQTTERRDIGAVKGLVEGTKLSKVSAESYANEFFASRGGVEEAAKKATAVLNIDNPVRSSDIFLAIQAISHTQPKDLFGGASSSSSSKDGVAEVVDPDQTPDQTISFAIYLHDPIHGITFSTLTQTLSQKWIEWLDSPSPLNDPPEISPQAQLPEEIAEIINSGGVDPREWVSEWIEEVLALGVGIVAQRYVARRMGVGEGGLGRGKGRAREDILDAGAGEAARAM
ncbi:MAG: hypothetical protein MMC33_009455 [Icmadophila ericetorum]|nr:hypothetical protein [Icmadophila ericetorum]